ncbi:MAG: hypothetical protein K6E83_08805 [Clostridium sp.]|nr:hypothetical protein [Clostridium sp.]
MDERLKRAFYAVPAAAGMVFCLWYLSRAAINLCYTDYIRLVNSYLPDVTNPAKFLVPDILTRCPVTYLFRIINVKLLRYNTWFDMILGVISMGLGAFALGLYARRREMNPVYFLLLMAVYYSLHQWEMLTNGTGWVCYLAVSGFFWHFAVLDYAAWDGASHRRDRLLLYLLPFPVILAAAGQYCASYAAILFFAYVMLLARDRGMRRRTLVWAFGLIFAMTAFGLYLWSNSYAVYEHRETTELTLMAAWKTDFLFPARFLVKSFASDLVGIGPLLSWEGHGAAGEAAVYGTGILAIALYLWAMVKILRTRMWEDTVLPILLVLSGGLNHLLVLAARWIFLDDGYGMSSRYALQYRMGILGILLVFAAAESARDEAGIRFSRPRRVLEVACMALACCAVLAGTLYTDREEIRTAPYRKAMMEEAKNIALHWEEASDEDLKLYLQHDPEQVRKAMKILEDNRLNVFR